MIPSWTDDITALDVEAIVNAANRPLFGGCGTDEEITLVAISDADTEKLHGTLEESRCSPKS